MTSKHQLPKLHLWKTNLESVLRVNMYGHWYIVPGSASDKEKLLSPSQMDFIACLPPLSSRKWQGITGNNPRFTQGFCKWGSWCKITAVNDIWDCRARQHWLLRKMMCSLKVHDLQQHRLCCVEAMGLGRVSRNGEASGKHLGCGWGAHQLEKHAVRTLLYHSCGKTCEFSQLCWGTAWSSN